MNTLKQSTPKARKDYDCMASEWLINSGIIDGNGLRLTFSEMRSVVKARKNRYKIKKGDQYLRQTNSDEGRLFEFIAIPEIHEICYKYDLYDV